MECLTFELENPSKMTRPDGDNCRLGFRILCSRVCDRIARGVTFALKNENWPRFSIEIRTEIEILAITIHLGSIANDLSMLRLLLAP